MTDDVVHFKSLERSRNAVLSNVVRRGFLGNVVEHVLRQSRRQVFWHITALVGIGTELADFDRHSPASIRTRQVGSK